MDFSLAIRKSVNLIDLSIIINAVNVIIAKDLSGTIMEASR
jgi:hypothetical protein